MKRHSHRITHSPVKNNVSFLLFLSVLFLLCLLSGCTALTQATFNQSFKPGNGIISGAIHSLSEQLLENASIQFDETTLAVMTFVNINSLYRTSTLGRHISEQLITELQKKNIFIIDVRKTQGILMREGSGEFSLSRQISEINQSHYTDAVVVGTYTVTNDRIIINARLLRSIDGMVLSSGNTEICLNETTTFMVADEINPPQSPKTIRAVGIN